MSSPNVDQAESEGRRDGSRPRGQLQDWLQARVKLTPGLLIQSPAWVRTVFDHAWAARQALVQQVRDLPSALWGFLLSCPGGIVAITAGESRYLPGPATIRQQIVQNVAFVSVQDLAHKNERPLHVVGHLIDHYLGCGGEAEGPWLSEGGGVTAGWREAGARLPALFALGYGLDEVARSSVRDYFAQSLAFYCRDRQRLNVADPQIDKWFRTVLCNETFWRAVGKTKGTEMARAKKTAQARDACATEEE